ncbi:hypothetical protein [Novosphingobium gossypii]|uniref:hypothetical protein n=1 Tax=Novosphingobium gossypii TaxID=1604774 RepID=UPI003D1DBBDF
MRNGLYTQTIVQLTHDADAALADRLEHWFLYTEWLWVALVLLLAMSLPGIIVMHLARYFS